MRRNAEKTHVCRTKVKEGASQCVIFPYTKGGSASSKKTNSGLLETVIRWISCCLLEKSLCPNGEQVASLKNHAIVPRV